MPNRHGPIPLRALRDLLGLVRVLYADWSASGAGPIELEELRGIGETLSRSLSLARRSRPSSPSHREAWDLAERATAELGELIRKRDPMLTAVQTASARVVGAPPVVPALDPHAKLRERYRRG